MLISMGLMTTPKTMNPKVKKYKPSISPTRRSERLAKMEDNLTL